MMKKEMRPFSLILIFAFAFSVILAGCGTASNSSSSATSEVQQSTEATTASTSAQDKVKTVETISLDKNANLKFTFWGSPQEKKAIEAACASFSQKMGIKVTAMHIPTDYETKVTTMIAANDAPDAGYLNASTAYKWYKDNKIYNIYDFFAKDTSVKKEDYLENSFFTTDANTSIGLSTAVETIGIAYNKDMFKEAGLGAPPSDYSNNWNFDEFLEVAKKLTIDKNGKNAADPAFDPKNIKQYGVNIPLWFAPIGTALNSNGADFVSPDGIKFGLTTPEATEVLQKLADLINKYHVAPSPIAQKSIPATTVALQSKKIAMQVIGQWELLDLGASKLNFGLACFPKFKAPTNAMIVSGANVVFKDTKYPTEAWELYKWIIDPAYSTELYSSGLWMPVKKDWYTNPELVSKWAENNTAHPPEFKGVFLDHVMNNSFPGPEYTIKDFGELNAIFSPALDQVWLGKKTAEEAMKEIEPKAQAKVAGRYK